MNGDIRPPRPGQLPTPVPEPSNEQDTVSSAAPAQPVSTPVPPSIEPAAPELLPTPAHMELLEAPKPKKPRRGRIILLTLVSLIVLALAAVGAAAWWYQQSLRPVNAADQSRVRVVIESGSTPSQIGQMLHEKGIIRQPLAFDIYTRLSKTRDRLQAGTYSLSPSESTSAVVGHLTSGKVDAMTITFYPGATLVDTTNTPESKKTDVTTVLKRAGYGDEEIQSALATHYEHPLFAGKPATASLEGYVYGETYTLPSGATVKEILEHTFDVFYEKIQAAGVIPELEKRGYTLYQGVTLASIVQREVSGRDANTASNDQRSVAQVFYNRLAADMPLGSDVTAYYGADQIGAERSVEVDTAYNTRKHPGLTPGPIATPGLGALIATAQPANNDYLFFLSGDDDVTYFGKTDAEHQANINAHCHVKCSIQ